MELKGRSILVLGGAGLVGKAVCRHLLDEAPGHIIVSARTRSRAEAAADILRRAVPEGTRVSCCWGNIFVRWELKDLAWNDILADTEKRRVVLRDVLDPMERERRKEILAQSTLARFVDEYRPDSIVDCINTATAFAYQDIYKSARELLAAADEHSSDFPAAVEQHLAKMYTPQLVRHMQILYEVLTARPKENWPGVLSYVKVGTSGTGGMGLNIPYTHGEEKPSSVLLSKTAVAGAHSLLLFLLARTPPDRPAIKEVKPTAAIAWSEIGYGPIAHRGSPIPLADCPPEQAYPLDQAMAPRGEYGVTFPGRLLENVYIDTGENGLYALGEFSTLTALGQMEFVTAEEVAENVVRELKGGNTGFDVISALDQAVLGPTYRAGLLRSGALTRMRHLEKEKGATSVAFEFLGPPRVSKLLFEACLLMRVSGDSRSRARSMDPEELVRGCQETIARDDALRRQMISVGIPVLDPSGGRLLRGPIIKADKADDGWVDLRLENMRRWQDRLAAIGQMASDEQSADDGAFSSRFPGLFRDPATGEARDDFDIGEVVGWILTCEDRGARMKS